MRRNPANESVVEFVVTVRNSMLAAAEVMGAAETAVGKGYAKDFTVRVISEGASPALGIRFIYDSSDNVLDREDKITRILEKAGGHVAGSSHARRNPLPMETDPFHPSTGTEFLVLLDGYNSDSMKRIYDAAREIITLDYADGAYFRATTEGGHPALGVGFRYPLPDRQSPSSSLAPGSVLYRDLKITGVLKRAGMTIAGLFHFQDEEQDRRMSPKNQKREVAEVPIDYEYKQRYIDLARKKAGKGRKPKALYTKEYLAEKGMPRRNPLISYQQRSKPSIADMDAYYRTLFRPAAEASYKEAFARVPLDIHVLFGNYDDLPYQYSMYKSFGNRPVVALVVATNIRTGTLPSGKPGDPDRVTSFTPFTLLHRLGDNVRSGQWEQSVVRRSDDDIDDDDAEREDEDARQSGKDLLKLTRSLQSAYGGNVVGVPQKRDLTGRRVFEEDLLRKINAGVGTAAGRLNALGAVSETWSDLFAKYLLTQRFDFDPEAGSFPKEIRQIRREWSALAHQHIINVISLLRAKGIIVTLSV